ncbi:MAG: M6 family metalloprotease domain-containing protein [Bacteroidales bacterium]|nr:M6 family metalloprotease domain-containing protein [Bacteroidales bacterium]MCM1148295.1 M6 family metalloprotease domain-containing protein [Bacteroidales bacterium]MCM1206499.1 M6 family metalloprotease domain-containing protein [Bacillota bacterium]MCM1510386.1 M6 family metalloprotease domain-containing protein [Clostridium sp.]
MKSKIISLFTLLLSTFPAISTVAVPAKPGLLKMYQADGTEITVRLMGDEHHHFYLSEDGYLLVNDNETFYYGNTDGNGNIISSGIAASQIGRRSKEAKQYLRNVDMTGVREALQKKAVTRRAAKSPNKAVGLFDTGFPSKGDQKGIVILVEYKDKKFTLSDPYDYFSRMLNENGFSDYGGTGCAGEYFRTSSKNQFRPTFDVFGPVTLSQNMSYYGGNNSSGDDMNPEKMATEACQLLDAAVDFSEYDRDNDGYIDNVFIFYAGRGEASGGAAATVWPHSWNITSATSTPYFFDGVRLDRYACSNEWEGSRPDGVGTFIHEFSHVMGLPDLYATSYTSSFTPGAWSVLDYGPYNNNGCTPPLYSIYERYSLGWMQPEELTGPKNVTMGDISSNTGFIIRTEKENEFFLFENRQQKGWDKYIPGHGMLVWHIDYNEYVWTRNVVNNTAAHQYVDLEEADGSQSDYSRAGDAFPGTGNVTSFTDDTTPSMKSWSGHRQELPITDIKETGGVITFKVAGGAVIPDATVAEEATEVTPVSFKANWQAVENADTYHLSVYTKDAGGTRTYLSGYSKRNIGNRTSTAVTGLEPVTKYYYTVYAGNEGEVSGESNEVGVETAEMTFSFLKPAALEATEVTGTSFTANWQSLDDAEEYTLNVYSKKYGEPEKDIVDFTGGVKNLPEGWKSNSTQSYANKSYSGEAAPSLRFVQTGSYIESPEYPFPVRSLSFWHRGSQASEENTITVSAAGRNSKWTEVAVTGVENTAGGMVTLVEDFPEDTYKIRIIYNMPGKGSLAVDDIVVGWGGDVEAIEEAKKKIQAPAVSLEVNGLMPGKTYYYNVQATDGELVSRLSNEIKVRTADVNTSIAGLPAGRTEELSLSGDILTITGVSGKAVIVTDVHGRLMLSTAESGTDNVSVSLPSHGIYIVRIDNSRAIKIRR